MSKRFLTISLALVLPCLAFAHDLEAGPNGGRLVEVSGHHIELVPKGTQVQVFVTDKNEKTIPHANLKGVAILLIDGKQQRVQLEPVGSDRLAGDVSGHMPAALKGVVLLSGGDWKLSAQFK